MSVPTDLMSSMQASQNNSITGVPVPPPPPSPAAPTVPRPAPVKRVASPNAPIASDPLQKQLDDLGLRLEQDRTSGDTEENKYQTLISKSSDLAGQQAKDIGGRSAEIDATMAQRPQDNIKFVMQQSPLFLGLAALAGGFFKTGPITALSAMNGAVQGIKQGDRQAYDDAMQKYQDVLKGMLMKFQERDQQYDALQKQYGLSLEGQQMAWRQANARYQIDAKEADRTMTTMYQQKALLQRAYEMEMNRQNARMIAGARINAENERHSTLTPYQRAQVEKIKGGGTSAINAEIRNLRSEQQALMAKQSNNIDLTDEEQDRYNEISEQIEALNEGVTSGAGNSGEQAPAGGSDSNGGYADGWHQGSSGKWTLVKGGSIVAGSKALDKPSDDGQAQFPFGAAPAADTGTPGTPPAPAASDNDLPAANEWKKMSGYWH
jgi:hypothetical protein